MIKNIDDSVLSNNDIIFANEDSSNVTFFSHETGIFNVDPNSINLDHVNFDENDPEIIIHGRLMAWRNIFNQRKVFKKESNRELILAVSQLTIW